MQNTGSCLAGKPSSAKWHQCESKDGQFACGRFPVVGCWVGVAAGLRREAHLIFAAAYRSLTLPMLGGQILRKRDDPLPHAVGPPPVPSVLSLHLGNHLLSGNRPRSTLLLPKTKTINLTRRHRLGAYIFASSSSSVSLLLCGPERNYFAVPKSVPIIDSQGKPGTSTPCL
jgi:hypothetical protein